VAYTSIEKPLLTVLPIAFLPDGASPGVRTLSPLELFETLQITST